MPVNPNLTNPVNRGFQSPPPAGPESDASTTAVAVSEPDSLRQELADLRDLNLRLAADFEHLKRRSRQEAVFLRRAPAEPDHAILEVLERGYH